MYWYGYPVWTKQRNDKTQNPSVYDKLPSSSTRRLAGLVERMAVVSPLTTLVPLDVDVDVEGYI